MEYQKAQNSFADGMNAEIFKLERIIQEKDKEIEFGIEEK